MNHREGARARRRLADALERVDQRVAVLLRHRHAQRVGDQVDRAVRVALGERRTRAARRASGRSRTRRAAAGRPARCPMCWLAASSNRCRRSASPSRTRPPPPRGRTTSRLATRSTIERSPRTVATGGASPRRDAVLDRLEHRRRVPRVVARRTSRSPSTSTMMCRGAMRLPVEELLVEHRLDRDVLAARHAAEARAQDRGGRARRSRAGCAGTPTRSRRRTSSNSFAMSGSRYAMPA